MKYKNKAQIGIEYLIIMGFLIFVIIGIIGVAFYFGGSIRDGIAIRQANNFAEKVISAAETVYYQGEPSKATITAYLPNEVNNINIEEDMIVFNITTNSGEMIIGFSSNVPIRGELRANSGTNRITLTAYEDYTNITNI